MKRHQEPPFAESARVFADRRDRLLALLQTLEPDQWERDAIITGRRHTVFSQTRRMALHEAAHAEMMREACHAIDRSTPRSS